MKNFAFWLMIFDFIEIQFEVWPAKEKTKKFL